MRRMTLLKRWVWKRGQRREVVMIYRRGVTGAMWTAVVSKFKFISNLAYSEWSKQWDMCQAWRFTSWSTDRSDCSKSQCIPIEWEYPTDLESCHDVFHGHGIHPCFGEKLCKYILVYHNSRMHGHVAMALLPPAGLDGSTNRITFSFIARRAALGQQWLKCPPKSRSEGRANGAPIK